MCGAPKVETPFWASGGDAATDETNQLTTIMNTTIKHPLHGKCEILPRTIRYHRDEKHPYGWEVQFKATCRLPDGRLVRDWTFSALGTDRWAAMSNALIPRHL